MSSSYYITQEYFDELCYENYELLFCLDNDTYDDYDSSKDDNDNINNNNTSSNNEIETKYQQVLDETIIQLYKGYISSNKSQVQSQSQSEQQQLQQLQSQQIEKYKIEQLGHLLLSTYPETQFGKQLRMERNNFIQSLHTIQELYTTTSTTRSTTNNNNTNTINLYNTLHSIEQCLFIDALSESTDNDINNSILLKRQQRMYQSVFLIENGYTIYLSLVVYYYNTVFTKVVESSTSISPPAVVDTITTTATTTATATATTTTTTITDCYKIIHIILSTIICMITIDSTSTSSSTLSSIINISSTGSGTTGSSIIADVVDNTVSTGNTTLLVESAIENQQQQQQQQPEHVVVVVSKEKDRNQQEEEQKETQTQPKTKPRSQMYYNNKQFTRRCIDSYQSTFSTTSTTSTSGTSSTPTIIINTWIQLYNHIVSTLSNTNEQQEQLELELEYELAIVFQLLQIVYYSCKNNEYNKQTWMSYQCNSTTKNNELQSLSLSTILLNSLKYYSTIINTTNNNINNNNNNNINPMNANYQYYLSQWMDIIYRFIITLCTYDDFRTITPATATSNNQQTDPTSTSAPVVQSSHSNVLKLYDCGVIDILQQHLVYYYYTTNFSQTEQLQSVNHSNSSNNTKQQQEYITSTSTNTPVPILKLISSLVLSLRSMAIQDDIVKYMYKSHILHIVVSIFDQVTKQILQKNNNYDQNNTLVEQQIHSLHSLTVTTDNDNNDNKQINKNSIIDDNDSTTTIQKQQEEENNIPTTTTTTVNDIFCGTNDEEEYNTVSVLASIIGLFRNVAANDDIKCKLCNRIDIPIKFNKYNNNNNNNTINSSTTDCSNSNSNQSTEENMEQVSILDSLVYIMERYINWSRQTVTGKSHSTVERNKAVASASSSISLLQSSILLLLEHSIALIGCMALRQPLNAIRLINHYQLHIPIINSMVLYPDRVQIQRQGALAIRNLVSRTPQLCPILLEYTTTNSSASSTTTSISSSINIETILKTISIQHISCQDEIYAALRDLGCTTSGTGTLTNIKSIFIERDIATGEILTIQKERLMFGQQSNTNFRPVYN